MDYNSKLLLLAAIIGGGALMMMSGDDEGLVAKDGPNGSTLIGDVALEQVDDRAWTSSQLVIGPGCAWIVLGAGFLPSVANGESPLFINEIDVPTLTDAIGQSGEYDSENSAWGFLSTVYAERVPASANDLSGAITELILDALLEAVSAERGCPRTSAPSKALATWARPRIRAWVRDRQEAFG